MYLFYNGKILTQDINNPIAEIVLVKNNKIIYVGNKKDLSLNKYLNSEIIKINLDGKILLPGFIDTHIHFHPYLKLNNYIDLSKLDSIKSFKEFFLKINIENRVSIRGYGLKISLFNKKVFNKDFLDEIISDIPFVIVSSDYHTYITNSKAIEISNIDLEYISKFENKIGFNSEDISLDNLNGYFYEDSYKIILDNFPEKKNYENLDKVIEEFHKLGIVSIEEMAFSKEDFYFYDKVSLKDKLRVVRNFPKEMLDLNTLSKGQSIAMPLHDNNWLKNGGLKLFYDGSLGSKTALLSENYPNSDYNGIRVISKKEFYDILKIYIERYNGNSIITHAIGDKAIKEVVEIYSKCRQELNYEGILRIEHIQHIDEKTIEEVFRNDIYCSMQPTHLGADIDTINNISWIKKLSYRFNSLKGRGVVVGFASDAPVETINPFLAIYSAITHMSYNIKRVLNISESITVKEAIKSYTIDAAKLSNSEKTRGSIEVGKLADLIIIDDYENMNSNFWLDAKSYFTMIDGKILFNGML